MPVRVYLKVKTFFSRHFSATRIFVLSFAGVILAGGILLGFPFSATQGPIRFVDALFTSTSAVCVTGLVVIDIGKDLSTLGQVITIFLFQIGGLGIITFSTVFFVLMGRGISFKGRDIVQSTFLPTPRRDFVVIAKMVLWFTFITESIGELHLRSKYHIEVIAVREVLPERLTMVPRADFVIKDSDVLVVIGKEKDIQKMK